MDRRQFLASAASLGLVGIWAERSSAAPSQIAWREDRKLYPQGVASGDPDDHSVVLWTRRPFDQGERHELTVEVARDADFRRVVATARAPVVAAADWTCRALVGGLLPATTYWYRFTDDSGVGSRIGRTITAPRVTDPRPVRFAFVSCNSVNEGAQNAYRRMIWEDERAPADRQLGSVAALQDPWHPAVLRLVKEVGAAGAASGKPVGVCGEAAADPLLAVVLAGLGVTSLSMSPTALADVRASLARYTLDDARAIAEAALAADEAADAREAARATADTITAGR